MFVVYGKDPCPECDKAKFLLELKGHKYETKLFGVDYTKEDLAEIAPSARSVPVIVKDGVLVGGLAQLKKII